MDFASLFSSAPPMLAKPTFGDPVPPALARQAIPAVAPVAVPVPAAAVRPVDPYAAGQGVTNGVYSAANAVGQGFNNLPGVTRVNDGLTGADNFVRGLFGADRRDAPAAVAAPAVGKVAVAAPAAKGFDPVAALNAQPLWSDGFHGVPATIQNIRDGIAPSASSASPATAAAASMPANPLVGAAQAFAAANGGISMHQLQGLSDAFSKSQKSEPKVQTAADAAIADAHASTSMYYTEALKDLPPGDRPARLKLLGEMATKLGALGNPQSAAVANLVNPPTTPVTG